VVLLSVFLRLESRVKDPLVPLRILFERKRGGSCLAVGITAVGMYGVFPLLTYDFQSVLRYSPVRAGISLPMGSEPRAAIGPT
jgi:hypothetical protein